MKTNSRQQLIHSAIKILCAEPGATMDCIAAASNVSRMTLFRVFKSRQQLINTVSLEASKVCNEIISTICASSLTTREKIEQSVKELIPVGAMFRFLYYVPWRSQSAEVMESEKALYDKWRNLLGDLKAEGEFRIGISIDWAVRSMDYLILAAWDAVDDGSMAPKIAHEQVLEIFFHGVCVKN